MENSRSYSLALEKSSYYPEAKKNNNKKTCVFDQEIPQ